MSGCQLGECETVSKVTRVQEFLFLKYLGQFHPCFRFLKTLITSGAIVSHCVNDINFLLKKRLVEYNRNLDAPLQ